MGDDDILADGCHVTDAIAEVRPLLGLLLEADVDGVESIVAFYEGSVRTAPDHVRSELAVQHLRVSLVVAGLQPGGEGLDRGLCLRVVDSKDPMIAHDCAVP